LIHYKCDNKYASASLKLLYSTNLLILLQNYEQSDTFQKTVNNLILLTEIRKNYRSPSGMFFKSKKGLPQNETHFAAALSNIFYYEVSNKAKPIYPAGS
jgi:hypothetical protein